MHDLHLPCLRDVCDGESGCGDFQRNGCGDGHGDGCDANLIPFSVAPHHLLQHSWNQFENGYDRVSDDYYCAHVNGGGCANESASVHANESGQPCLALVPIHVGKYS